MPNQVLNSTYEINYSTSGTKTTIGPYSGKLAFNSDSSRTFYNCQKLQLNLQNLVNNISMDFTINASHMFYNCSNLTGSPVCPSSVTDASNMYANCSNLTGDSVCLGNVTNAAGMYSGCHKLSGGNIYLNNCTNCMDMFSGKNNSNVIHFYVKGDSYLDNCLRNGAPDGRILGNEYIINWTNMTNGYYNYAYNIYIYNNAT